MHALQQSVDDESFERRAPYEIPARYTRRGQWLGLTAVLASLAVVAYAIFANEPWIAGILGTLDLVALAAVFGSNRTPRKDD